MVHFKPQRIKAALFEGREFDPEAKELIMCTGTLSSPIEYCAYVFRGFDFTVLKKQSSEYDVETYGLLDSSHIRIYN